MIFTHARGPGEAPGSGTLRGVTAPIGQRGPVGGGSGEDAQEPRTVLIYGTSEVTSGTCGMLGLYSYALWYGGTVCIPIRCLTILLGFYSYALWHGLYTNGFGGVEQERLRIFPQTIYVCQRMARPYRTVSIFYNA